MKLFVLLDSPEITVTEKDGTQKKVPNTAPAGKALDLLQSSPVEGFDARIIGTSDYAETKNSDVKRSRSGTFRTPQWTMHRARASRSFSSIGRQASSERW